MIKINYQYKAKYEDEDNPVYFEVNLKELLNINLNYPGIGTCLRRALRISRRYVPLRTGRMMRSYTMERVSKEIVRLYFNPTIILTDKVKDYYPMYLEQTRKRRGWLQKVINAFLVTTVKEIKAIEKIKEAAALLMLQNLK